MQNVNILSINISVTKRFCHAESVLIDHRRQQQQQQQLISTLLTLRRPDVYLIDVMLVIHSPDSRQTYYKLQCINIF
jgi:hypothetical protein